MSMPATVFSMTLSAKSSALHPGSQLLSTLIWCLAPSTSTSTSLALHFSLPLPPSPLPPLCSFFCCCWGALLRSRSFHYHNHLFSTIGESLVINFSLSHCVSVTVTTSTRSSRHSAFSSRIIYNLKPWSYLAWTRCLFRCGLHRTASQAYAAVCKVQKSQLLLKSLPDAGVESRKEAGREGNEDGGRQNSIIPLHIKAPCSRPRPGRAEDWLLGTAWELCAMMSRHSPCTGRQWTRRKRGNVRLILRVRLGQRWI